ncbi:hypothetical protein F5141DRAFT_1066043 [Pisolithus sp. B1]|nr:hypothetical protein F5141DRAFT_1066043 [Pisolithus sp. B1]
MHLHQIISLDCPLQLETSIQQQQEGLKMHPHLVLIPLDLLLELETHCRLSMMQVGSPGTLGSQLFPPHSSEKLDVAQRAARKAAVEQSIGAWFKELLLQRSYTHSFSVLIHYLGFLQTNSTTCINEIAKAHSILPEKVRLLITGETHYRKRHEESLVNTLVHIKAHQELQEMVANDPDMQNLDEETKQKYLGELKESRSHKAVGVRSTNTATSHDVQATLKKIYGELQALTYHTGIYACLFVTHGHVYDMHTTTWFGTDNIMDFWEDWMKLSPDYIIKQLELWACNKEKNIEACDSLENMQKQAKNGLDSGFSSITKHLHQGKAVCLQFVNFEQIKYKFGIDYEGWPDGIPFSSPYKIQTIDEIHCFQHHNYHKQVDARHKAGKTVGVPHQGHSDKGKKCKAANNKDAPQASKKACRGRAQTTPKSQEIITTSDKESDGEEHI